MKQLEIIKNRSDIGAGTRGSDMGVDAMEIAAINAGNDYFKRFPFRDVETDNESVYDKVRVLFAKRIRHVAEQCERVCEAVKASLSENNIPIILSGDHSSALGTISGVKAWQPEKRVGVVWIDAHADLHSPFTTPSGNVHGMPLAAAIGEDNAEYQVNQLKEETQAQWERLKNISIAGPKVRPEDLIFFGVRDTEPPEDKLMAKYGIKNYKVAEIRHRGLQRCLEEAIAQLFSCDHIYISFDVDSLDCDLISRGTGTPVSKGFDPGEVEEIITAFIQTGKVACLEVTEINPLLDNRGNKMAETAFEVLDVVTAHLVSKISNETIIQPLV